MRTVRIVLTLAVALVIAGSALAGEKRKGKAAKKPPPPAIEALRMIEKLDLTADQKDKIDQIRKECGPKVAEAQKKLDEILTPEQRRARAEAAKEAKAAGKKGKEAMQAIDEAMKLTDEQKEKIAQARKAMAALQKEIRGKVMEVLTEEQRENLTKLQKGGKKKEK